MDLEQMFADAMLKQVIRTARGRALLLAQAADAEDNGEVTLFDQAIELVDDPRFRKMIARHRDDEVQHGRMFRECVARQGMDVQLPDELKVLEHVGAEYDGFFSRPLSGRSDLVRAYCLLQALEERAVAQYPAFEEAFRPFDRESARTFAAIRKDEERHLLYCQAITRHYADARTLEAELSFARHAEAIAFEKTRQATAQHIDRLEIIENPMVRLIWRLAA